MGEKKNWVILMIYMININDEIEYIEYDMIISMMQKINLMIRIFILKIINMKI